MPEHVEPIISPGNRQQLENYLRHHLSFFAEGGPGIGKSLAVDFLGRTIYAERCAVCRERGETGCGSCKPLKLDITEDTEVRHLMGEPDLVKYFTDAQRGVLDADRKLRDYFVAGPMIRAMREGRLLIVEELDRAGRETLFPVLFDAIEYRRAYVPELGESIEAAPGFNIVFTVNRQTDIGTVALPKALLRRQRSVRFYDPSLEFGENRWHAARYETEIVFGNVRPLLKRQNLSENLAKEAIFEILYEAVFPIRASSAITDPPTPAETTLWFKDILLCDGAAFLSRATAPRERLRIALLHRGALVKSGTDEPEVIAALSRFFLDERSAGWSAKTA